MRVETKRMLLGRSFLAAWLIACFSIAADIKFSVSAGKILAYPYSYLSVNTATTPEYNTIKAKSRAIRSAP